MKLTTGSNQIRYFLLSVTTILVGILVAVFFAAKTATLPQVESTLPHDQDIAVLDNSTIDVKFVSPLTKRRQAQINVSFSPKIDTQTLWMSSSQIQLRPLEPWPANTLYFVSVNFGGKIIYSFSFKTNKYSTRELQEQGQQQAKDDVFFGQKMKEFDKQFPWYKSLPIVRDDYTIVYDFEKQAFRLRITKPDVSSGEVNEIKTDAAHQLQGIGVDVKTQQMYVIDNNNVLIK